MIIWRLKRRFETLVTRKTLLKGRDLAEFGDFHGKLSWKTRLFTGFHDLKADCVFAEH